MKILVACEESQAVTREFRVLGHEAYSCDIVDHEGDHDEWHIKDDVLPLLNGHCEFRTVDGTLHTIASKWDMIVAFPPCTDLAVSGAAWFEKKRKDGSQKKSIEFFMNFINADCNLIAIENPIGIISGKYIKKHYLDLQEKYNFPIKATQIIQPWMFGHMEKKSTCLWLKGLPLLTSTDDVREEMIKLPKNIQERIHYLPPGKTRSKLRSKTFPGIAKAMAEQWGKEQEPQNGNICEIIDFPLKTEETEKSAS